MIEFMNENFLLKTSTAQILYHKYAKKMPVMDYHCHIPPQEIAMDRRFENITQIWLGADHYKWRLMRSAGVDERYITGESSDKEKFLKWAEVLGKAIGNPLYHWSHLELQRFFGYNGILNKNTAQEVWDICNEKLKEKNMSAKGLISMSSVTHICTTDDPIDDLKWHEKIAEDQSFKTKVLPAFRPDKAVNIDKPTYLMYLDLLSQASGIRIESFGDLIKALKKRMDFFEKKGCRVSDNGLDYVYYIPASKEEINNIFLKRLKGENITQAEIIKFKTACMIFLGRENSERKWVMQLHYGCKRDNNLKMFEQVGADIGFDCISSCSPMDMMADYLNALDLEGSLPKTIVYNLNPQDNQVLDTIVSCFQNSEAYGKIQHGSAWWFNDHITGMTEHLKSYANIGYLSNFVGMLTDSRSFLSYPRHEYFRRILCDIFGRWVEDGLFPQDMDTLGEIICDISYNNVFAYFKL